MTTPARANRNECTAAPPAWRARGQRRAFATQRGAALLMTALVALTAAPCARAAEPPPLYQAGTGYICPDSEPLQEHLNGTRSENDWPQQCLPGLDSLARVQIVAMDAENHPFVWVCTALIDRQRPARPPYFVCGYTLAQWILGEDRQPVSKAVLQNAARQSTMADVRRTGLP